MQGCAAPLPTSDQLTETMAYFRDLTLHAVPCDGRQVLVAAARDGSVVAAGGSSVGEDGRAELQSFSAGAGASDEQSALLAFLVICVEAEARDKLGARSAHASAASLAVGRPARCSGWRMMR